MAIFSYEVMTLIIGKASALGLAARRKDLLKSFDPAFVAQLETGTSDGEQLALDVWAMNRMPQIVGDDVPLRRWLTEAAQATAMLPDSAFFRESAAKIVTQAEPTLEETTQYARSTMESLRAASAADPGLRAALTAASRELESIAGELRPLGVHKRLHDLLHEYQIESLPVIYDALKGPWIADEFYGQTLLDTVERFVRTATSARTELEKLPAGTRERAQLTQWLDALADKHARFRATIVAAQEIPAGSALKEFRSDLWQCMTRLNLLMSRRADDLRIDRLVDHLRSFASDFLGVADDRAIRLRATATELSLLQTEIATLLAEHDAWQTLDDDLWEAENDLIFEGESEYALGSFTQSWPRVVMRMGDLAGTPPGAWFAGTRQYADDFALHCPMPVRAPIAAVARKQFRGFVKSARSQFYAVDLQLVGRCNRLSALTDPLDELVRGP